MTFQDYITQLAALYRDHDFALDLNPPASASQLVQLEAELGHALKDDLRAAWLHANGGQEWETVFSRPGSLGGYWFLSAQDALLERAHMAQRSPQYLGYAEDRERDHRIQDGWYHDGWLPFANFSGATLLLIQDYSPAPGGQAGQIIAFTHDPDTIEYVAPSLSALLGSSLENIRHYTGEFVGS
ncbi:hypothetical protein IGB42_01892 [Andreprevotia sp. IGB-42]|uniref:SMI1/KNR4 family protein n=1 Tax=Andreprevotia sp. IGB-42 TaxID=2497473 RepID=UPI00135C4785|nr:SMI1/KNR4 family protein [Andreprevotia sp. IGB-42]KAF0813541.1 hypothetical protein IGB42_01892 [Andreprevotia sp. IGB-42]